jgi:hypothetical protein
MRRNGYPGDGDARNVAYITSITQVYVVGNEAKFEAC